MKQVWEFNHSDFALSGEDESISGVCMALSARWVKMMLKSPKTSKYVPEIDADDRSRYFYKPGVKAKVQARQTTFDAAQERVQTDYSTVVNAHEASKVMSEVLGEEEWPGAARTNLALAISQGLGKVGENVEEAREDVFTSAGLRVSSVENIEFVNAFDGAQQNCAYLFASPGHGHAFGGFVTGGTFYYDFYFFDPNAGEYLASGSSDGSRMLRVFQNAYAARGRAGADVQRYRLVLAG